MNFQEYAPLARRTLKVLPYQQHLEHMSLGFCGEAGELCDAVKKHRIYGKPLDKANIIEEVGDVLWYVVNLCEELQVPPAYLDELMAARFLGKPSEPGREYAALTGLQLSTTLAMVNLTAPEYHKDFYLMSSPEPGSEEAHGVMSLLLVGVAVFSLIYGFSPYDALPVNIDKLAARYGDKYSDYAALNRDLPTERAILEEGAGQIEAKRILGLASDTRQRQ